MVGLGVPDDAAVMRLNDDQAIIATTDFFTPIVDDPYQYGAIAAANALSDVYAMGGRPLLALNIVAFPPDLVELMLTDVLRGSAEKVREAGAVLAGGHTIQDKEPKVGLAVIGIAHPDRVMTKDGARPGDLLVLSKPLGSGTIATAAKGDLADPAHMEETITWMSRLNRAPAEAAQAAGAKAATDITGFGFLGHALEVADSSKVTLRIDIGAVPLMTGAEVYADQWIFPGGSINNMRTYEGSIRFEDSISQESQMLLFDTQTSGGLLIAIPSDQIGTFEQEMKNRDAPWWKIGEVVEREKDASIVVNA
jgi:selenide,water dikinase